VNSPKFFQIPTTYLHRCISAFCSTSIPCNAIDVSSAIPIVTALLKEKMDMDPTEGAFTQDHDDCDSLFGGVDAEIDDELFGEIDGDDAASLFMEDPDSDSRAYSSAPTPQPVPISSLTFPPLPKPLSQPDPSQPLLTLPSLPSRDARTTRDENVSGALPTCDDLDSDRDLELELELQIELELQEEENNEAAVDTYPPAEQAPGHDPQACHEPFIKEVAPQRPRRSYTKGSGYPLPPIRIDQGGQDQWLLLPHLSLGELFSPSPDCRQFLMMLQMQR
jgi:hypothetical protein